MQPEGPYRFTHVLGGCPVGKAWAAIDEQGRFVTVAVLDAAVGGRPGWREAFAGTAELLAQSRRTRCPTPTPTSPPPRPGWRTRPRRGRAPRNCSGPSVSTTSPPRRLPHRRPRRPGLRAALGVGPALGLRPARPAGRGSAHPVFGVRAAGFRRSAGPVGGAVRPDPRLSWSSVGPALRLRRTHLAGAGHLVTAGRAHLPGQWAGPRRLRGTAARPVQLAAQRIRPSRPASSRTGLWIGIAALVVVLVGGVGAVAWRSSGADRHPDGEPLAHRRGSVRSDGPLPTSPPQQPGLEPPRPGDWPRWQVFARAKPYGH